MEMDDIKQKAEDISDHVGDYLGTFKKLTVLKLTEKSTGIASGIFSMIVLSVLGFFILFFGGFGLAWWLGDLMESRTTGFLLVGGFFLLLVIILLALRKKIIFPFIRNLIIRKIYE